MAVYFISGHTDVSQDYFIEFYVPMLEEALKDPQSVFLVGDAKGIDTMAQHYLILKIPEHQVGRIKIFHKGEFPNNCVNKNLVTVGGFINDEDAAVAMTLCSDEDIALIGNTRNTSLTAKNILRRFQPQFDYKSFILNPKSNREFWDMMIEHYQ